MRPRVGTLASTLARPAVAVFHRAPTLARYLSITALTQVTVLLLNLGSGIVQARALGPVGRGELTIAMLWPSLIVGLGGLGLAESVTYHTAAEGTGRSRVLATALAISVPQTLALVLIAWSVLPIILQGRPPQVLSQTRFYLWYLPLFPLLFLPQGYLQGRLAVGWVSALVLCTTAASTALLAVLWAWHELTVHSALAATLASWALSVALGFGILFKRRDLTWRPNPGLVRPLLWFGVRRHLGSISLVLLNQRIDLIFLSLAVPAAALGTYAVAGSAGTVASALPLGAAFVLYPTFARQTAATLPFAMSRFLLTAGLLTVVTAPALLVLPALAVPYVFGPAFESARPLAALLSLGYLIRGWNGMLTAVISGAGRPFTASIGQTLEFAALAALLTILIPRFGLIGAATAVILAATTSFLCLLTCALFITRLTPLRLATLWSRQIRSLRQPFATDRLIGPGALDQ